MDTATDALEVLALAHNYNDWVISLMRPWLGPDILEVGCGIGNLTQRLVEHGHVDVLDNDIRQLHKAATRVPCLANEYCQDIARTAVTQHTYDTVVCVNVLEHIPEHVMAVKHMTHALRPGGHLCLFVPAHQSCYSTLDKELGHVRRYDKRDIAMLFDFAELETVLVEHVNMVGLFGWWLNGKVLRRRRLSPLQALIFDKWVPWIRVAEMSCRVPFGMSLLAIGRKAK